MENKKELPQVFYVRESAFQSVISDLFSFGCLFGLLMGNYKVLNGDWYVTIFILILWWIALSSSPSSREKRFYTVRDLRNYLETLED